MLVFSDQPEVEETEIGPKAKHLQELVKAGFNVPEFVVIPNRVVQLLLDDKQFIDGKNALPVLKTEVIKALKTSSYAVRSAAMVEDGEIKSFAGQFKTILGVTKNNLEEAIMSVVDDASKKLGDGFIFSVIVQEYINPDQAGVIFSRDPMGGREMVIEYNQGVGETVVGGKAVSRAKFLFSGRNNLPNFAAKLAQIAREIETKYSWPQDIEWAEKDNVLYLLQTRPITSIANGQWEGFKYLETLLTKDFTQKKYLFQQTTIGETFNKPRPLAFSIAESLYAAGGPVEKVYRKLNIVYKPTKQLKLFGNELYIDRQAEIKSILPAFGYLVHKSSKPRLEKYSQLITTVWNWFCLSVLSTKPDPKIQIDIEHLLSTNFVDTLTLKERWLFILKQYEVVYETNIRAQKAVESLESLLGSNVHLMANVLKVQSGNQIKITGEMIGNSFNLDDNSSFSMKEGEAFNEKNNGEIDIFLKTLPRWKQEALITYIKRAQYYGLLREQARWVSVKLASYLRSSIVSLDSKKFVDDPELVYFATIDELLNETESVTECLDRKKEYLSLENLIIPKNISSFVVETPNKDNLGVSTGVSRGVLVTEETLNETKGEKILYTRVLSPDLVKYFDQIVGIVSQEGGLLSHLSIVARESSLPVVVTTRLQKLNHELEINGSTGEIKYL